MVVGGLTCVRSAEYSSSYDVIMRNRMLRFACSWIFSTNIKSRSNSGSKQRSAARFVCLIKSSMPISSRPFNTSIVRIIYFAGLLSAGAAGGAGGAGSRASSFIASSSVVIRSLLSLITWYTSRISRDLFSFSLANVAMSCFIFSINWVSFSIDKSVIVLSESVSDIISRTGSRNARNCSGKLRKLEFLT